jgi:hypothetical protein
LEKIDNIYYRVDSSFQDERGRIINISAKVWGAAGQKNFRVDIASTSLLPPVMLSEFLQQLSKTIMGYELAGRGPDERLN